MMDFTSVMEDMVGQRMLEPIVLRKFLDDYKKNLETDVLPHTDADIQLAMELADNAERFNATSQRCKISQLDQIDDSPVVTFLPGQPEGQRIQLTVVPTGAHKLKTFKALIESKDVNQRNPFRRSCEVYKLAPFPTNVRGNAVDENPCPYYNDLLISVRVYRNARATHVGRTLEKPVFAEQFQCLGSNLLTDLRDKISCICNKHHFYDISDNPNASLPKKLTDPGFFFITDTFYNDKRNPDNADYSTVILKWAKSSPCFKMINFKVAKMEETRFIDLKVSLGFPQLYQHHGNCEHLFTFSQIELLTPSLTFNQNVSRDLYPRLHSFSVYNNRLCNMCGMGHYIYIVSKSDRQLHDPAYLCSKCFHTFHYIDGKKIGEFNAYRLYDFGESHPISESAIEVANAANEETNETTGNCEISNNTAKSTIKPGQTICHEGQENYRVIYNENENRLIVMKEER